MKYYPQENADIDLITDINYLDELLASWPVGFNLVTKFDFNNRRFFHCFEKTNSPDLNNGILRVWNKNSVIGRKKQLKPKKRIEKNIFEKIDILDRVFNRNGKLYDELSNEENLNAYQNMIQNAKEQIIENNYIMAAYFLKGALMYKKTSLAYKMLEECRKHTNAQKAA